MLRRLVLIYACVFIALLAVDWALGCGRFYVPALWPVFTALNFPSSLAFLWLERQPTAWWHNLIGPPIDDEYGQFIVFGLMVAVQAAIITGLLLLCRQPGGSRTPSTRTGQGST